MNAHDKWLEAPYEAAAINHAALQAEIVDEATSRVIEWQHIEAAGRDAHDFELLQNELDFIISYAAQQMAVPDDEQVQAMAALGMYVAAKVRQAALRVATHYCVDKS